MKSAAWSLLVACTLSVSAARAADPRLIMDIDPGYPDGSPTGFVTLGDRAIFSAHSAATGRELYVTQGTTASTHVLVDLASGATGSDPLELTHVGNRVFFSAFTPSEARELWVSDGTAAGTVMVKDLNPGALASSPHGLLAMGDRLVFLATVGATQSLYVTDGTVPGTLALAAADSAVVWGNQIIFTAGNQLRASDGTVAGTHDVRLFNTGAPQRMSPTSLGVFLVSNDTLWKTDGTALGTVAVKQLPASAYYVTVAREVTHGVVFLAGGASPALWVSDGTDAGTVALRVLTYSGTEAVVFNGEMYFPATEAGTGTELWATDGTAAGTRLVKDIRPGAWSSSPYALTVLDGRLYFAADEPTYFGYMAWNSDGTDLGTTAFGYVGYGSGGVFGLVNRYLLFGGLGSVSADVGIELWGVPPCGDNVLDFGEDCDRGNPSTDPCCKNDCTAQPVSTLCLTDGVFCNGVEACDGLGHCVSAGDPCPPDECQHCNEVAGLCADPSGVPCGSSAQTACDDPDTCNGSGSCDLRRKPSTFVCRPAVTSCDAAERCSGSGGECPADVASADGAPCADTLACNGAESCLAGVCQAATAPTCEDNDACTADSCVEPGGCQHTRVTGCCNTDAQCTDADACTADQCRDHVCVHDAVAGCGVDAGAVAEDGGTTGSSSGGTTKRCACAEVPGASLPGGAALLVGVLARAVRRRGRAGLASGK